MLLSILAASVFILPLLISMTITTRKGLHRYASFLMAATLVWAGFAALLFSTSATVMFEAFIALLFAMTVIFIGFLSAMAKNWSLRMNKAGGGGLAVNMPLVAVSSFVFIISNFYFWGDVVA